MDTEFISVYDINDPRPKQRGWYAVLICWEPEEGHFPDAAYWDGENFDKQKFLSSISPVSDFIDKVFDTKDAAHKYAHEKNPNW